MKKLETNIDLYSINEINHLARIMNLPVQEFKTYLYPNEIPKVVNVIGDEKYKNFASDIKVPQKQTSSFNENDINIIINDPAKTYNVSIRFATLNFLRYWLRSYYTNDKCDTLTYNVHLKDNGELPLGKGAFGVVRKSIFFPEHKNGPLNVAIKTLYHDNNDENTLTKEIVFNYMLNNLVKNQVSPHFNLIYYPIICQKRTELIMEYSDNTLGQLMDNKLKQESQISFLIIQILSAIFAMFVTFQISHCDIKINNILFNSLIETYQV